MKKTCLVGLVIGGLTFLCFSAYFVDLKREVFASVCVSSQTMAVFQCDFNQPSTQVDWQLNPAANSTVNVNGSVYISHHENYRLLFSWELHRGFVASDQVLKIEVHSESVSGNDDPVACLTEGSHTICATRTGDTCKTAPSGSELASSYQPDFQSFGCDAHVPFTVFVENLISSNEVKVTILSGDPPSMNSIFYEGNFFAMKPLTIEVYNDHNSEPFTYNSISVVAECVSPDVQEVGVGEDNGGVHANPHKVYTREWVFGIPVSYREPLHIISVLDAIIISLDFEGNWTIVVCNVERNLKKKLLLADNITTSFAQEINDGKILVVDQSPDLYDREKLKYPCLLPRRNGRQLSYTVWESRMVLSHFYLYSQILQNFKFEYVLILEDDTQYRYPTMNFVEYLRSHCLLATDVEWDALNCKKVPANIIGEVTVHNAVMMYGSFGLLFKGGVFEEVTKHLDANFGAQPVDYLIAKFFAESHFTMLSVDADYLEHLGAISTKSTLKEMTWRGGGCS